MPLLARLTDLPLAPRLGLRKGELLHHATNGRLRLRELELAAH
jgi:hypothetical protein